MPITWMTPTAGDLQVQRSAAQRWLFEIAKVAFEGAKEAFWV